jgi:FixJ family two-component response regulator
MVAHTRVLFVDDEVNILKTLRRLFRREPWQKHFLGSGEEALALIEGEGPADVIVTDQRMHGMTGLELLREILQRHPECVRIVLSGYTDVQSILDAVNQGAIYKFLTKPWDDEVLRQVVCGAVESVEIRRENERLMDVVQGQHQQLIATSRFLEEAGSSLEEVETFAFARHLMEELPVGVAAVSEDGTLCLANRVAHEMLGALGVDIAVGCPWPVVASSLPARAAVRRVQRLQTPGWKGTVYALWED